MPDLRQYWIEGLRGVPPSCWGDNALANSLAAVFHAVLRCIIGCCFFILSSVFFNNFFIIYAALIILLVSLPKL